MSVVTVSSGVRPIPSLFSPTPTFLPITLAQPVDWPINVSTPDAQWAYAAKFARAGETKGPAGPVAIRLLVDVSVGAVGLGCLNTSGTDFIDEAKVEAAAAPVTIELVVSNAETMGSLIVRNVFSGGASEVRILDLQCFALDVGSEGDREPALSDPRPMRWWERYYGNLGETAIEKLRAQAFRALTEPVILRWIDGLQFRILPGDQLSRALFVSNTYEPNTLCALRRLLGVGGVFLDVGANAGVMSLAASRWMGAEGRVFSFEPSLREYRRLVENLELNDAGNVIPVRAAVSSGTGPATLRVAAAGHGGLNTLGETFAHDGVEMAALEQVDTTTLDDFIKDGRINRVSVVKVDVEGGEGAVLAGSPRLLAEHRPALVLEVNPRALAAHHWTVTGVEDLLRGAAYRLFSICGETASLEPITRLTNTDEENIVALPEERGVVN